jgi:hypothetical protein
MVKLCTCVRNFIFLFSVDFRLQKEGCEVGSQNNISCKRNWNLLSATIIIGRCYLNFFKEDYYV